MPKNRIARLLLVVALTLSGCSKIELPEFLSACPALVVVGGETITQQSLVKVNDCCTGSVIAPRAALTAKHCLANKNYIRVNSGAYDSYSEPIYASIVRPHSVADIAVFIFEEDLGIPSFELSSKAPRYGEPVALLGFGHHDSGKTYGDLYGGINYIAWFDQEKIYTYFQPQVCYGDSGGPALNRACEQVGLHHATSAPDDDRWPYCGVAGVEIRIDTYRDWILGTINAAEEEKQKKE